MKKIAVIGSGVSGIAAAYYLKKKGFSVDIIESELDVGGRVGSSKFDDRVIDFGGKNIGYGYRLFREFVADQGNFHYEYFGVNTSKVVNGNLVPISREKNIRSVLKLFKLANLSDLIKLFKLLRHIKKNPESRFLNSSYFNVISDKFDHRNITHYFSKRCCENILRTMIVRMNGAEPDEYFIGNIGSNIASAFDKYDQIAEGMDVVIKSFLSKVDNVRTNLKVTEIVTKNNRVVGVKVLENGSGQERVLDYERVLVATSAHSASKILHKTSPAVSGKLSEVLYYPVVTLVAEYEKPVFNKDIRAVTFSSNVPLSNAGSYGINDLNIVRYTFSGREAREILNDDIKTEDLLKIAEHLMPSIFHIHDNKVVNAVHKYFKQGLCAYNQYYHRVLRQINLESSKIEGLYLSGDYFRGASIEACFRASKDTVDSIFD